MAYNGAVSNASANGQRVEIDLTLLDDEDGPANPPPRRQSSYESVDLMAADETMDDGQAPAQSVEQAFQTREQAAEAPAVAPAAQEARGSSRSARSGSPLPDLGPAPPARPSYYPELAPGGWEFSNNSFSQQMFNLLGNTRRKRAAAAERQKAQGTVAPGPPQPATRAPPPRIIDDAHLERVRASRRETMRQSAALWLNGPPPAAESRKRSSDDPSEQPAKVGKSHKSPTGEVTGSARPTGPASPAPAAPSMSRSKGKTPLYKSPQLVQQEEQAQQAQQPAACILHRDRNPEPDGTWFDEEILLLARTENEECPEEIPLTFQNTRAAQAAMPILKEAPAIKDLPSNEMKQEMVKILVAAMRNMDSLWDRSNAAHLKFFNPKPGQAECWRLDQMEASAWNLLNSMIRYHQTGLAVEWSSHCFMFQSSENAHEEPERRPFATVKEMKMDFRERFLTMVDVLRHWKNACNDTMLGWKTNQYVIGPLLCLQSKAAAAKYNRQLEAEKRAKEREEKGLPPLAPRRRRTAPVAENDRAGTAASRKRAREEDDLSTESANEDNGAAAGPSDTNKRRRLSPVPPPTLNPAMLTGSGLMFPGFNGVTSARAQPPGTGPAPAPTTAPTPTPFAPTGALNAQNSPIPATATTVTPANIGTFSVAAEDNVDDGLDELFNDGGEEMLLDDDTNDSSEMDSLFDEKEVPPSSNGMNNGSGLDDEAALAAEMEQEFERQADADEQQDAGAALIAEMEAEFGRETGDEKDNEEDEEDDEEHSEEDDEEHSEEDDDAGLAAEIQAYLDQDEEDDVQDDKENGGDESEEDA